MMNSHARKQALPVIHPDAAGIDFGSTFHVVAVRPIGVNNQYKLFKALQEICTS